MAAAPTALYAKYTAPTEIEVPDSYTNSVTLSGAAAITPQTESTVYRLTGDVTMTPSGASFSTVSYLYTSDSADNLVSIALTEPSGATSVGLSVSAQVSFDCLKDVSFTAFTSGGKFGGAVMVNGSGALHFSNNEGINFSSNSVIQSGMNAGSGGGILVEGTASFLNNGEIIFKDNTAQEKGGAIALNRENSATEDTHLVLSGNDSITFTGNKTNNQLAGLGGALYNILGNLELNHNGEVTFSSNTAEATYMAQGGAIYSTCKNDTGLTINLSYNDSLTFEGNLAQSGNFNATDGNAYGGAIQASGTDVILNSNGSLTFKNNKAYTTKSNWVAQGGAIRFGYDGALAIQNNGTVIFEGNQTQVGNTVKYNSIYADDFTVNIRGVITPYELNVDISAPEDGSVEFRDCVYIDVSHHENSYLNLNTKFTDESGKEIEQTGDIIFTGSYMTSGDKTSEFKGLASLNDGRLIVKDGAVLKADTLAVTQSASGESSPTLVIQNGTLAAGTLTFAAGSALEYLGVDNNSEALINISTSLTMGANMSVTLGLLNSYSGDTLKVAVAKYTGTETNWATLGASTAFTVNSLLWTADKLGWTVENGTAYITGTTTKKDVLNISNQDLVLDSENALGDGTPIVSTGTTEIDTKDGVTVALPCAIQNGGELTMGGTYDGSELKTLTVNDTRVATDGTEGNNGFFREGGTALIVVENTGEATLTVNGETIVTDKDGKELLLYASGLAANKLDYSNYHIEDAKHTVSVSEITEIRPEDSGELTISMNNGTLVADEDATNVQSAGGTIITEGDVAVGGNISGSTSVVVGEGTATLSGNNDYTGKTTISGENTKLIVGNENALGKGEIYLDDKGTLDLNNKAISNAITVTGCELHNADNYTGTMEVSGNLTICGTNATANTVNLVKGGTIAASADEKLTVNTVSVSEGNSTIKADVVITPDGSITLNDGSLLTVTKSLTLGSGASIILNGGTYASGDTIMVVEGDMNRPEGQVPLANGYGLYTLEGTNVILTAMFDQNLADALTVGNWGIPTASRSFVNAVRGQRSNSGCIANGRGTAWVAVLGASNKINGLDISLHGAALGVDLKVGRNSSIGIATGYTDADIDTRAYGKLNQEGSYVAAYGEHGLKQLSTTSCLSFDWVAAYGITDTKADGTTWEQDSLQLNSRLNWNKKISDRLSLSVFSGLEYFASNSDTADGVKTGSIQNLRGEIGVGARYVAWGTPATLGDKSGIQGCEKLVLNGEIRYMNDMVRSNPVIRMDGLSGGGANPGRQGIGIEAGATYRIGERWSASANYSYNTMEDSKEHRVNVGVSYTF